jgi:hypothetical protein
VNESQCQSYGPSQFCENVTNYPAWVSYMFHHSTRFLVSFSSFKFFFIYLFFFFQNLSTTAAICVA